MVYILKSSSQDLAVYVTTHEHWRFYQHPDKGAWSTSIPSYIDTSQMYCNQKSIDTKHKYSWWKPHHVGYVNAEILHKFKNIADYNKHIAILYPELIL